MSGRFALSDEDVARLHAIADVLIEGTDAMPAPSAIDGYDVFLRRAVAACGHGAEALRVAIDAMPAAPDRASVEAFARDSGADFAIVGQMVSAAYYMAPEVLARLGFPADRRQPAEVEDFVNEYETGIFDPVINMAPRYRDVGPQGQSS